MSYRFVPWNIYITNQPTKQTNKQDLGPQVGYQTVFFWEYFGPLVIYPLFLFFPALFYSADDIRSASKGDSANPCLAQKLACAYWCFHYAKRIYETYYVHTFSHGSMPIGNLYRNCGYYWSFGAAVSFFLNHPLYTSPNETRVLLGFAAAMLCQIVNYQSHVTLSKLRGGKGDKTSYKIPKGGLFTYVTCANYAAEIYGWLCFNIATQTAMGVVFMLVGGVQMLIWAKMKHKRLRNIFDGKDGREKYPRRWIVLPPFV